ncbi:hypothetical protein J6590_016097 [Homalodisca vitripennis]|nr:hypothetical protein J6590_016097 [Homalodisca vitripennis]
MNVTEPTPNLIMRKQAEEQINERSASREFELNDVLQVLLRDELTRAATVVQLCYNYAELP